jgi:murein L,D-transpeptidase YcbB/YkuD
MHMKVRFILGAVALALAAPLSAAPMGDEPIAIPGTVRQGIDFIYVDPQLSTVARRYQRPTNWLARAFGQAGRRGNEPSPMFTRLGQGLEDYRMSWGRLPQVKIPAGPTLKSGSGGKRVELLRTRLGLPADGGYDRRLSELVRSYQLVHGLGAGDGIAGPATIASLNRGADYYERKVAVNMERAWRLPRTGTFRRYALVDSGAAEVYLVDRDRIADGMRAIVGSPEHKTPMMAVLMRNVRVNPYWNVPAEMARTFTAPRVLKQGVSYLSEFHYEVLSDWTADARPVDPAKIDWKKAAAGRSDLRVRQLPGPWNSMGEMKFEMPNDYGIYLHDTPKKELFAETNRWISNGCVRLEDYRRFASWFFEDVPEGRSGTEELVYLPQPVPVFMTYLTVEPWGNGVRFRADPYRYDDRAIQQMFGSGRQL